MTVSQKCPVVTTGNHVWKAVDWAGEAMAGRQCTNCGESAHKNDFPLPRKRVAKKLGAAKRINSTPIPPPEPGLDLSQVIACTICGLEVANFPAHQTWHDGQNVQYQRMANELHVIRGLLEKALQGTAYEMPVVIAVDPAKPPRSYQDVVDDHWDRLPDPKCDRLQI